ncbi:50S ribosomal protein L4 [Ligilactobacillus pobuzihii]|nr:50S ribosomal protein L4 [Ligilactobacillus pobuzihii]MBN7274367.1 50S ribosomal protein L4 [Ligilactobacillus pobuzihii]HIZ96006.1 50S ribosomal protein L4 [Candidatus Ligilactobacillus excrementavium]
MNEEEKPKSFKKMKEPIHGYCPRCGRPMRISYGWNSCPNCHMIFQSNFK